MLAQGEQPGQSRIPDAGVPVGLVHGDAERGRVPVGRVQVAGFRREPVVELPVVTRRRDEQQAAGELTTVGIDVPGHDEQVEMALSPDLPAGQGETEPAQEGEDTRYDRLVQSRPQRWRAWPEGPILFRRRSELQPRASTMAVSAGKGKILARRPQLTRATSYPVTG